MGEQDCGGGRKIGVGEGTSKNTKRNQAQQLKIYITCCMVLGFNK